jgi:hypothetical protein
MGPSSFRLKYLQSYAQAVRTWLHNEAEVIDTTIITPRRPQLRSQTGSRAEPKATAHSSRLIRMQQRTLCATAPVWPFYT